MIYNEEQRARMIAAIAGKIVASLEYVEAEPGNTWPSYWVMTFTDGSEISFRFMSELL